MPIGHAQRRRKGDAYIVFPLLFGTPPVMPDLGEVSILWKRSVWQSPFKPVQHVVCSFYTFPDNLVFPLRKTLPELYIQLLLYLRYSVMGGDLES